MSTIDTWPLAVDGITAVPAPSQETPAELLLAGMIRNPVPNLRSILHKCGYESGPDNMQRVIELVCAGGDQRETTSDGITVAMQVTGDSIIFEAEAGLWSESATYERRNDVPPGAVLGQVLTAIRQKLRDRMN